MGQIISSPPYTLEFGLRLNELVTAAADHHVHDVNNNNIFIADHPLLCYTQVLL